MIARELKIFVNLQFEILSFFAGKFYGKMEGK